MIKKTTVFLLLTISFLYGQSIVQVNLKNGKTANGEFIGTYMEHVHLLVGENINYFKCDDIQSVTKSDYINVFEYDCSKNTVTADILFPPKLNPMTGEWETIIPDVFNPEKRKVLAKEEEKLARQEIYVSKNEEPQKNSTEKEGFSTERNLKNKLERTKNNFKEVINTSVKPAIYREQLEKTKKAFREIINPKTGSTIPNAFYEESKEKPQKKRIKQKLTTYAYEDGTVSFSEDEIRRFIKKEIRKELRKTLPYEIKKHKERTQNKLFQNVLLGCGAWFFFMMLLSF